MISSRANASVRQTYRLRKRRERERRGVFLIEGHRAVAAAAAGGVKLLDLFYTPAAAVRREPILRAATGAKMHAVAPPIMAHLTDHDHPPDMLAVAPLRPATVKRCVAGDLTVVVYGVRDPAIAGAILAAAAAADATGVIAMPGTADLFAPACVRAAAGAHFALPVAVDQPEDAVAAALAGRRLAALRDQGTPVCSASMRPPLVLVIGEGPVPVAFAAADPVAVPPGRAGIGPGLGARAAIALHEVRRP